MLRFFVQCTILMFASFELANAAKVTGARLWNAPDHARFVLELSEEASHKVMMLSNPKRLVLDISGTSKATSFDKVNLAASPVKKIRSAARNQTDLRIVLDLNTPVKPRSFILQPNEQYGTRLVVDMHHELKDPIKEVAKSVSMMDDKRDVVIVIDPGHGGEDPGALGPGRVREKDVVLAISKELKNQFDAIPGFTARLTRSSDYYIGLRKRTQIARKHNADLLISVHADAFTKAQANGASVFALSNRGATSESARWLAKKENAADLIGGVGGVSLDGKDDVLAGVLLDLSTTASLKASLGVGSKVLSSMGKVARLHKKSVQQAGFVVLKSPDIPSILVETGFISNPAESRRLKTRKYQKLIASQIKKGVEKHFRSQPPVGSYLAWEKRIGASKEKLAKLARDDFYVVKQGDTLLHIALRNDTTLTKLKRLNKLKSDTVRVGQKLQLPASS